MGKRRTDHPLLSKPLPGADTGVRTCDWPGCTEDGEHRAPKARDRLREYHWFCMDHVRVYNKRWNYYQGMSELEIEDDKRHDTVWNRPSWPLGDSEEAHMGPKTRHGAVRL